MIQKIELSIPWIIISTLFLMIFSSFLMIFSFNGGTALEEAMAKVATTTVTVSNSTPSVASVILNGGSIGPSYYINLNAGTLATPTYNIVIGTTSVTGTTTVTDFNGYTDIKAVTSTLFLTQTSTCGLASTNPNWCYYIPSGSTGAGQSCVTSSCSGQSCAVACTAYLWFFAEDSSPSSTNYSSQVWQMTINAVDAGNLTGQGTGTQEVSTLLAIEVTSSISYGTLVLGATSTDQITLVMNAGNHNMDPELYGTSMFSGGNVIDVGQQKYSSNTLGDWLPTTILSTVATRYNLDVNKGFATSNSTLLTASSSDNLYWQIKIPGTQAPGTYNGTNTLTAAWQS